MRWLYGLAPDSPVLEHVRCSLSVAAGAPGFYDEDWGSWEDWSALARMSGHSEAALKSSALGGNTVFMAMNRAFEVTHLAGAGVLAMGVDPSMVIGSNALAVAGQGGAAGIEVAMQLKLVMMGVKQHTMSQQWLRELHPIRGRDQAVLGAVVVFTRLG